MLFGKTRSSGWRGAALIAVTYVYFLIFAQFAFLTRLGHLGIEDTQLKAVMAAMALGGILLSLLTPRIRLWPAPAMRLQIGFMTCAVAALLALLPMRTGAAMAVAFLIGAGLGLLTVTLVTHLRVWTGERNPLLMVGLGTGLGYFACNVPVFFTAQAEVQSLVAALLCVGGTALTLLPVRAKEPVAAREIRAKNTLAFPLALAGFAALVWLDSAAFFIIQSTPQLKAGTWQGDLHLWTNGLLHFGAALLSVLLLGRRGLGTVLAGAFVALGAACLLLLDPSRALIASVFYPIGVSLYSVALVAYPSLLAPAASTAQRGRMAGWIYAVAGWVGSAMGIGMGQHLGHVPPAFVAAAGAVVLTPGLLGLLRRRMREATLTAAVALLALGLHHTLLKPAAAVPLTQVERGRQVYIAEGCIACHSQYVRPGTGDELMWGPVESMAQVRQEHPPLIGNRRQGPDLSEVGERRSALWLKMHFYNPPQVSGASIMPSYGFLFRDERGNDLVAYLESLRGAGAKQHEVEERMWQPNAEAVRTADAAEGEELYQQDCATCHSAQGRTRLTWRASFKRLPPNLAVGPYFYLPPSGPSKLLRTRMAQIVKFGIPGTDMAGHEYLSDRQVASLSLWLSQVVAQSNQEPNRLNPHTGDDL